MKYKKIHTSFLILYITFHILITYINNMIIRLYLLVIDLGLTDKPDSEILSNYFEI